MTPNPANRPTNSRTPAPAERQPPRSFCFNDASTAPDLLPVARQSPPASASHLRHRPSRHTLASLRPPPAQIRCTAVPWPSERCANSLGRFGPLRVITHVMTAASIGASRGGGYARYLESKTVEL